MKQLGAELLGTFWLVMGGCGSAVLAATFPDVGIGLHGVALAFGLTVLSGRSRPAEPINKAIGKLKLKEEPYSPASRVVRPTVRVVAFQLSHQALADKLLVGCEYANGDAAGWVRL